MKIFDIYTVLKNPSRNYLILTIFSFYFFLGTSGYILLSSFVEDQVIHSLDLVELASKPLLSGSVIQVVEYQICLKTFHGSYK